MSNLFGGPSSGGRRGPLFLDPGQVRGGEQVLTGFVTGQINAGVALLLKLKLFRT
jgi:hypothetical protein